MDVKSVCLGILTSGPASGYDLKKCFESTFGHFFPAGYGSIYPALAALADHGLVCCEEVAQEGKPDRKVYSITADGEKMLADALDNPAPTHRVRSEFLATLFFAHLMSAQQIDTVLDHRCAESDAFVEELSALDFGEGCEWPPGAEFAAGFGIAMAKACKRYIVENRHKLVAAGQDTLSKAEGWR